MVGRRRRGIPITLRSAPYRGLDCRDVDGRALVVALAHDAGFLNRFRLPLRTCRARSLVRRGLYEVSVMDAVVALAVVVLGAATYGLVWLVGRLMRPQP